MKLFISFSGGETSAFMTHWLINNRAHLYEDVVILFANTGQENEKTLVFVDKCDREWGLGVVWLEAKIIHEYRKGTQFNIVNFETASRNGEPFEEMIIKYGIPNKAYPHCTRELKQAPMYSYLKHIGWNKGGYQVAIGIRVDEIDRVSSKMMTENIVYPLIEDIKMDKNMIEIWWAKQLFTLDLPEHMGNCSWCWKKSNRKLLTLTQDSPEIFDFPRMCEFKYGLHGHNVDGNKRVFFRGNMSTEQLFELSKKPFKICGHTIEYDPLMDSANGCSESCEVF